MEAAPGGTVDPTNKVVVYDSAYGGLPTPVRAGYSVADWLAQTNGVVFGVSPASLVSIASNHVLCASWTANVYAVTFDAQGGSVSPAFDSVTYGQVHHRGEYEHSRYNFEESDAKMLLALFAAWCAMLLLRPGIGTGPG